MALVEDLQNAVVDRLDSTGYEYTSGLTQRRQQSRISKQVLDLYSHVIGQMRVSLMQLCNDFDRMLRTIEKIGGSKSNVLCTGNDLLLNVGKYNFGLDDAKLTAVDWDNWAMAA